MGVLLFFGKVLWLVLAGVIAGVFILWPVNDQRTSKTAWVIWWCVMFIFTILIFTNLINWTP
jgi:hypothetical protein